jgi:hypothetical protein
MQMFFSVAGAQLMMFEVLHRFLVHFRGGPGLESAQIAALAGFDIFLARVQTVFARFHFSNHLLLLRMFFKIDDRRTLRKMESGF